MGLSPKRPRSAAPLADLVGRTVGDAFARQGFAAVEVVTHWQDIVGEDLARRSEPLRLHRRIAGSGRGRLCARGAAPSARHHRAREPLFRLALCRAACNPARTGCLTAEAAGSSQGTRGGRNRKDAAGDRKIRGRCARPFGGTARRTYSRAAPQVTRLLWWHPTLATIRAAV
jgi:hypothetical protein